MRITSLALSDLRRYRDLRVRALARPERSSAGPTRPASPRSSGPSSSRSRARSRAPPRDLDGLVPWGVEPEARDRRRHDVHLRGRGGRAARGPAREVVPRPKGTVRLELDGEADHGPGTRRRGARRALGRPDRGRSSARRRRSATTSWPASQRDEARAPRPPPGVDQRRRPRHQPGEAQLERALHDLQTRGVKNPGRLKVAEDAVTDAARRLQAGEDALQRLEHDRDALAVARERRAEAETALAERRAMLEKARQAERLTAERDAAQEKYERYRDGRHHPRRDRRPRAQPPVARRRCPCSARRSTGCARVDAKIATLQGMLEGEVQVNFEAPPEVRWRPLSRWSLVLVADRRRDRDRQLPARLRRRRRHRRDPHRHRRDRGRDRARARDRRLVAAAAARRPTSRCATSRSTAACAAARSSSRSCARPRPSTTTSSSASA